MIEHELLIGIRYGICISRQRFNVVLDMVSVVVMSWVVGKMECGAFRLHYINVAYICFVVENRASDRAPRGAGVCHTIAAHNRELFADILAVEGGDGFDGLPRLAPATRVASACIPGAFVKPTVVVRPVVARVPVATFIVPCQLYVLSIDQTVLCSFVTRCWGVRIVIDLERQRVLVPVVVHVHDRIALRCNGLGCLIGILV